MTVIDEVRARIKEADRQLRDDYLDVVDFQVGLSDLLSRACSEGAECDSSGLRHKYCNALFDPNLLIRWPARQRDKLSTVRRRPLAMSPRENRERTLTAQQPFFFRREDSRWRLRIS